MIECTKYTWGYLNSNMYLFENNGHILVIDPIDNDLLLKKCMSASSITILLTHEHFDHICGLNQLQDLNPNVLVIASALCSERIQNTKSNLSEYANVLAELSGKQLPDDWKSFTCKATDITFDESFSFRWANHSVELLYTPGHSEGSCCILMDDMLFVGDTILENNLMVKFPGSSKKIYQVVTVPVLEKLLTENKVSYVYPGHGDVMTPGVSLQLLRNVRKLN